MTGVISFLVAVGFTWLAFGLIGGYIATAKGRDAFEGALFGFLLGPIGLLVAAMLPNVQRTADIRPAQPEPPAVRPIPTPGRVNVTARDDFLADALVDFRRRSESDESSEESPGDSRSIRIDRS